jgi:hypothetical protein
VARATNQDRRLSHMVLPVENRHVTHRRKRVSGPPRIVCNRGATFSS